MAVDVAAPVGVEAAGEGKAAEVSVPALEAWYMDDSDLDQRLPHRKEPNEAVSQDVLDSLGVLSWYLPEGADDSQLEKIRSDRGYNYTDVIEVCPEKLPNYEAKIKTFFEEHLHTDEEIRLCLDGSGYFDVRDAQDRWVRIALPKNWMIILPEGMFHRFTLDEKNYIKAMRFFIGDPVWTPFNREPALDGEEPISSRQKYVDGFIVKADANGEATEVADASLKRKETDDSNGTAADEPPAKVAATESSPEKTEEPDAPADPVQAAEVAAEAEKPANA